MNYLAPIRFALAPVYRLFPDPRTLLVIQNIMFWWVVPAAYTLVRSESGSRWLGVSAAAIVPSTPLLWPLVLNDFRELQLALPFVVWAVQGVRSRRAALAALGIAGMLACRQEFAVMAATFALIPPRSPEPLTRALRWRHVIVFAGFHGSFLDFSVTCGSLWAERARILHPAVHGQESRAAGHRFTLRSKPSRTAWDCGRFWLAWRHGSRSSRCRGSGARAAASGRSIHFRPPTGTTCAYMLPMTALVLSAGLIGYARAGRWILNRRRGVAWAALAWAILCAAGASGTFAMKARMDRIPIPIAAREAADLWRSIEQVGPDEGVLVDHLVSAPLSSRPRLYGYLVNWNLPMRYPKLDPGIRWLFIRNDYPLLKVLLDQGFMVMYRGERLTVAQLHSATAKRAFSRERRVSSARFRLRRHERARYPPCPPMLGRSWPSASRNCSMTSSDSGNLARSNLSMGSFTRSYSSSLPSALRM